MRKENFTKGPWRIEEFRDFTSIMAGDSEICYMDDDLNRHENARMIVSAPEMYALLGRLEDYFQNRHIYGYGVEEGVSADLLREIKNVMKRAEGKMVERE